MISFNADAKTRLFVQLRWRPPPPFPHIPQHPRYPTGKLAFKKNNLQLCLTFQGQSNERVQSTITMAELNAGMNNPTTGSDHDWAFNTLGNNSVDSFNVAHTTFHFDVAKVLKSTSKY